MIGTAFIAVCFWRVYSYHSTDSHPPRFGVRNTLLTFCRHSLIVLIRLYLLLGVIAASGCIPHLRWRVDPYTPHQRWGGRGGVTHGTLWIILFYIIWITISFLLNFLNKAAVFVFFFLGRICKYCANFNFNIYTIPWLLFVTIFIIHFYRNPILEWLISGLSLGFKTCIIIFGCMSTCHPRAP
nr:hypothetical protein [Morchella crassipes]